MKIRLGLCLFVGLAFVPTVPAVEKVIRDIDSRPISVLFLGNSYTSHAMKKIREVFKFREQVVEVMAITPGGAKLEDHVKNKKQIQRFIDRKYDVVVIQEQSQIPSLSKKHQQSFSKNAGTLHKWIKDSGAETVLFMTWGRRDGDLHNRALNPNFEIMQNRLSTAYRAAADKYKMRLAPVGDVFAKIKQSHPQLFDRLYAKDGSHPGPLGVTAIAYVIYASVSGQMPPVLDTANAVQTKDEETVWRVVKTVMDQEKFRAQNASRGKLRSLFK